MLSGFELYPRWVPLNDIHMVVEIFCRITLNSTVGDKRHPRLFSSQISPPHQSCLPRQRHMEIMRKKFGYERLLMNAVCSSLIKECSSVFLVGELKE